MNFKLNIQLFGNAVIPFDNGRDDKRDIEGLWLQALATSKALTAAIGCEFGSVLNIQDAGQKEQGKVYLDKNNGKLYKCLNTTTSVSNTTENFALFNVQQNSDRLDNLIKTTKITVPWSKFNIVSGGQVISRNFVEAMIHFSDYNIDHNRIIALTAYGGYGYSEYAVYQNEDMRCGQILNSDYCKSPEGDMMVLILYI